MNTKPTTPDSTELTDAPPIPDCPVSGGFCTHCLLDIQPHARKKTFSTCYPHTVSAREVSQAYLTTHTTVGDQLLGPKSDLRKAPAFPPFCLPNRIQPLSAGKDPLSFIPRPRITLSPSNHGQHICHRK